MKAKPKSAKRWREVALSALVNPDPMDRVLVNTEELCRVLGVADARQLRRYHDLGLPVEKGPNGANRYPLTDCVRWHTVQVVRSATAKHRKQEYLGPHAAAFYDTLALAEETGIEGYVLVPLAFDDPRREDALRIAAAGRRPPPRYDIEHKHYDPDGD